MRHGDFRPRRADWWIVALIAVVLAATVWVALTPTKPPSEPFVRIQTTHPDYDLVIALTSPKCFGNPGRILKYAIQIEAVWGDDRMSSVLKEMTWVEDESRANPLFRKPNYADPDLRLAIGPKGTLSRGTYHVRARAENGAGFGPVGMATVNLQDALHVQTVHDEPVFTLLR